MTRRRAAVATALLSLLVPPTVTLALTASAATQPCSVPVVGITSTGDVVSRDYRATTPASIADPQTEKAGRYAAGSVPTLAGRWQIQDGTLGEYRLSGRTVVRGTLYLDSVRRTPETHQAVSGGFTGVRSLTAAPGRSAGSPQTSYGLVSDQLVRWTQTSSGLRRTSVGGFAGGRALTVMANNPSYDTLLMTSASGALYAVRVPRTAALTPRLTVLRSRSWQGFEQLAAYSCGSAGTVLAAFDADSHSAYVYTLGHARGLSTVITSKGRAGAWADRVTSPLDAPIPPTLDGD